MIGKFFHTPKPKRFNIPYRYHDPDKEEMKEREDRIKTELGINEKKEWKANYHADLHGRFRQSLGDSSKSVYDSRRSNLTRLIIFFVILAIAIYLILKF